MDSRSLHDLTFDQMEALLTSEGLRPLHAKTLWNTLQYRSLTDPLSREDLAPPLRRWLEAALGSGAWKLDVPPLNLDVPSSDGLTRKSLLKLADNQEIETVIMGYDGRHTACISTQAGCAMGCVFCATGQMGFARHLTTGEIVAQALHVDRVLRAAHPAPNRLANDPRAGERLRNIVLMGMGEPLHNYDNVMTAAEILCDSAGLSLGTKQFTLSTVGVVPGILRMAEEKRPINLAVSLHGATQAERAALVPAAKKWPLDELMDACRTFIAKQQRRIFYEWTLIEGKNDTPEQAHAVGQLLQGQRAQVNLIPLNPTAGYHGAPTGQTAAYRFQEILKEYGLPSTIRQRRGIDIAAGCGQLATAKR